MNWRVIFWGTALQILFGFFLFMVPAGSHIFLWINDAVVKILNSARYLNVMPLLIRGFAFVFTKLMRVSGAEAFCVSSNIFFGVESALTIRPHLNKMTQSELHTVLTAGMATIASSMLATYVFMLHTKFPTIAGHLISASILSAPAALVMSKILLPESQVPETLGIKIKPEYVREKSWIESIISGAGAGVKLVVGIVALAPDRTSDLARVGFRALLAATLACLMTAAIAGTFYNGSLILMVK